MNILITVRTPRVRAASFALRELCCAVRSRVAAAAGADALAAAQVVPFTPPGEGFTTNFFSGRVYDPQAVYIDDETVTIVFAGYNTPQPSNNLGDYRSIGRFQDEGRIAIAR
jgi:hypothetical protein